MPPRKGGSRATEVAYGTARELPILQRWMAAASIDGVARVIRSRDYDDYDFLLLDQRGFPLCYVEIKCRRVALARFGDAIAPTRKHLFAVELRDRHAVPFLMVVEYTDALVEVDLASEPNKQDNVTRHDRPGKSVPHCYWSGESLTVLDEGDNDDVLPEAA